MPHEPGSVDDILTFETIDEPLAESPLDRFESLSHAQILGAFVRPGWNGNGWVAYSPTEPIDGTPAIMQAFGFDSRDEALEFVARWIHEMTIRPDEGGEEA